MRIKSRHRQKFNEIENISKNESKNRELFIPILVARSTLIPRDVAINLFRCQVQVCAEKNLLLKIEESIAAIHMINFYGCACNSLLLKMISAMNIFPRQEPNPSN